MRVHELAKELGLVSKDILSDLKDLGIEAKNHMSALEADAVKKIREKHSKKSPVVNVDKPVSSSVSPAPVLPKEEKKQVAHAIQSKVEVAEPVQPVPKPVIEEKVAEVIPAQPEPIKEEKKILEICLPISLKDLAFRLSIPVNQLILKFMNAGEIKTINDSLSDKDSISLLCLEYGFEVHFIEAPKEEVSEIMDEEEKDKPLQLTPRAAVVTFMGHVDHGKTSLMDFIRKTKVVEKESGGITQHIGAYQITFKDHKITFLDTPGHEAFTMMRARGAQVTDIVVLVVAADDGMMPQTHEAISHCRAAGVPIIVALNKMDKPNANPETVKRQLSDKGMLPEEWGGQTIVCDVSAKTGKGVDHLLEMILLQAEIMELKADSTRRGKGIVVESKLTPGKGAMATILVKEGIFRVGDAVICGTTCGRIKALLDDHGRKLKEAGPATPVEILGLSHAPEVGVELRSVKDEKFARQLVEKRTEDQKTKGLQLKKVTLEDIFQQISTQKIKEFRLILKVDVKGSLEALKASLESIPSDKVELKVIHESVGDITENDVMLASASGAVVIGFHVKESMVVKDLAKKEGVQIRLYSIIYQLVDDVKLALEGLLEPIENEVVIGHAHVQKIFDISKSGRVAGCSMVDGKALRSSKVRVLRKGDVLFEGGLQSLKRFKDEVKEVRQGFECGIRLNGFEELEEGDTFEFYEIQKTAQKL